MTAKQNQNQICFLRQFLSGWEKNNVEKADKFFVVFLELGSSVDAS